MSRWLCVTCGKPLKPRGVAAHRAMHARRGDGPVVMETFTYRYTYDFREDAEKDRRGEGGEDDGR